MDKNCGNGRWNRNGARLTAYQRLEELVDLRTQAAMFRLLQCEILCQNRVGCLLRLF